jgi:hypothetical protein
MATTNYKFEKRQRDLAKKKKQEEKLQKKLEKKQSTTVPDPASNTDTATTSPDQTI